MKKSTIQTFQNKLLDWYLNNSRNLPWRTSRDPYLIWVSEIMLQQTRVETVLPYYKRWIKTFPTLETLAEASEDQVLSLWEGLGYYTRARNLHLTSKIVTEKYGGILPGDSKSLQALPGIGRYTAGAVASIAFGENAPIIDGNIRRVFTRYFNISTPIQTSETENHLWELAQVHLPQGKAGDFNQALMELGALICLPKNPTCENCPLKMDCLANQLNLQESRPVRKVKTPLPLIQVAAAVFQEGNLVFLAKRPPNGLLGGLWEFPGGKQKESESLPQTLRREIQEELTVPITVGKPIGIFNHAYTHYKVTLHAFFCKLNSHDFQLSFHTDFSWVPLENLPDFPMGKLDRMISRTLSP
jgi:A/G-specific adenine glycosylase